MRLAFYRGTGSAIDKIILESKVGEHYGTVGIVCFLIDVKDVEPGKPFCSQICSEALGVMNVFGWIENYWAVSPQELYMAARGRQEAL